MAGTVQFKNLVDMFETSVKTYRNNRLFGVKRNGAYHWMTYQEAGDKVRLLRGGLNALGVGPGDVVAIISNNRPEWAICAYATYSVGGQFVPMYEVQLAKDWQYILNDCGAKVLIVANDTIYEKTKPLMDELDNLEHIIVLDADAERAESFDALLAKGADHGIDPIDPDPDDVCGFIYTSGTTGNPKGVLLTHGNITSNINAVHEIFPMDNTDVSLSFLPWAHSFGQTCELHSMLSYGAAIGLAESVQTILDNLLEVKPTLLFSVPRIFNRIYDGVNKKMASEGGLKQKLFERTLAVAAAKRRNEASGTSNPLVNIQYKILDRLVSTKIRDRFGGRLRYAFSGGAALSKEVGTFIDSLGITVYEGYGLTETSPIITANSPGYQRIGSVGRAIPGVRVEIDKSAVEGVSPDEGEIICYGPNIMKGYHNLPEANDKVFTEDGGFRTGDMGKIDRDGFLYITGRVKEQYKLENGKYVVPAPLEEKLKLSAYINNIMIDGTNRPFNIAVIVPDLPSLRDYASQHGISAGSDQDLIEAQPIIDLIHKEIETYSKDFKGYERPRKFVLDTEEFSPENDLLTPSLKTKRRNVTKKYGDRIDALYAK